MKKLFALCTAMAMLFVTTVSAFAAPTEEDSLPISNDTLVTDTYTDPSEPLMDTSTPTEPEFAQVMAYPTSQDWNVYSFIGSSYLRDTLTLVYNGNHYTAAATSFGGDCTSAVASIYAKNNLLATFSLVSSKAIYPKNPSRDYIQFDVVLNFSGNSATSRGTITRI